MTVKINSLVELEEEAARFSSTLVPQDRATVILLSGELGAGKTAYAKAVAKAFGVDEVVNSPTFVLEKRYSIPNNRRYAALIHIDAYRLNGREELKPLDFESVLQDPQNLVLLEWPEQVGLVGLTPAIHISIETGADGTRRLTYG